MLFMYYGLLRVCSVFLCSPAAHMTPRADQARTHLEHLFLRNFYRILISDATFPSYGTPHRTVQLAARSYTTFPFGFRLGVPILTVFRARGVYEITFGFLSRNSYLSVLRRESVSEPRARNANQNHKTKRF